MQPYLVFSRFQHLLFLEVCVPTWLMYLRVLCTLLILGHFSSFLVVGQELDTVALNHLWILSPKNNSTETCLPYFMIPTLREKPPPASEN